MISQLIIGIIGMVLGILLYRKFSTKKGVELTTDSATQFLRNQGYSVHIYKKGE